jgi:ABC-2 type transport system permease protein
MKRFWFYVRLYFKLISQYIKMRMQYRFDFFISTFSMILGNLSGIISLWIIMKNLPTLAGWTFHELVFIYGFSLIAQAPLQICFDNIWSLRMHVNQGTFIKYYFKPIHSLFYYVSEVIDLKGFGQLAIGIAAFAWAQGQLAITWTPQRMVLLPIMLFSSATILVSMMLIAASASFWIKDSFSVLSFINGFRDHSRYPMDIYNLAFKFLFTWILPLGFIAFYPSEFFLRPRPLDWSAWCTPFLAVFLFWLAIRVWNKGIKAWGGTGS